MTSNRPYLIRAVYDWIIDNGMTPHLLVDATHPSAVVPTAFVEDGRIVLNVAPQAVHGLQLDNDGIRFSARFGGSPFAVELSPHAVLGLYARENGQGMLFPDEATEDTEEAADKKPGGDDDDGDSKPPRPSLRIVK
ncbi:MAG: ClpXP protease specificity-enhancing factor [Thiohalocapsa sp.]|nr:ClpXP protease specificity-enhancing factor [Thiohalocapsa sp.]